MHFWAALASGKSREEAEKEHNETIKQWAKDEKEKIIRENNEWKKNYDARCKREDAIRDSIRRNNIW